MTIKQQLIPLRIGKGLLSLVALFVMLLAPQRAWAQTGYGLTVAGVTVTSDNAANVLSNQETPTVVFNSSTNTLTLNNASFSGQIVWANGADLTVEFMGSSTIDLGWGGPLFETENTAAKLLFVNTGGAACPLTMTSYSSFMSQWADGSVVVETSANPESDWWLNDNTGTSYEAKLMWNPKYDISVGGTVVSLANKDKITNGIITSGTVSFDPTTNTLTLTNVVTQGLSTPFVESSLANGLIVKISGNSTINIPQTVSSAFKSTVANAPLTFTTDDSEAELAIVPGDATNFTLFDGFTVSYQNNLYIQTEQGTSTIRKVVAPFFYSHTENGVTTFGFEGENVYYSIDYVSSELQDVANVAYDPDGDNVTVLGPCTVTAYSQVGTTQSETATAKFFGFADIKTVFSPNSVLDAPTLVPATDGVQVHSYPEVAGIASFNQENGKINISGVGSTVLEANFTYTGEDFYVLNPENGVASDNPLYLAQQAVTVVPPAPTIAFDGTKTYLNSDKVTISLPTSLTGNQNATIKYSWDESCEPGNGNNYTDDGVTLNAGTNTLYAWVRYNGQTADDALYSERVSQEFTAKTDIDQFEVTGLIETNSVVYTGSAIAPTFTLYDAKEPTNTLRDDNYDVRIEKYSEAAGYTEVQSIVDAGTYNVYAVGKGDTYGGEKLIYEELVVNKADLEGLPSVAADDLVYDGTEQVLLPITVPDGVTVEYFFTSITEENYKDGSYDPNCAGEVSYSTTIPKATNAGYFAIIYKVDGGNNYNNIMPSGTIKVAIYPAEITELTIATNSLTYTGEAQTVTITSVKAGELVLTTSDYDVSYEVVEEQGASPVDAPVETGTYNAVVTGKGNFTGTKSAEFTVLKDPEFCFYVDETISNGDTKPYVYGEEQTLPELKRWDNGSLKDPTDFNVTYTSSDPNVATIDNTGKITIVGVGLTEIRASIEATEEYAADEAWFIMKVVPTVPKVSIKDGAYQDGAYFTGQILTLTTDAQGGVLYYSYGYEEDESKRTLYEGEISLPKGEYEFYPYTRCGTVDNPIWSYTEATELYVYDEPTISKDAGEYEGDIEVEITNLPNPPHRDNVSVTAYYYLGDDDDNEENDIRYTAGDKITVRESTKLNVYLLVEGDSGKRYKTKVIEREYTIKDIPLDVTATDFHNHWMTYYHNENGNVGLPEDQNIGAYVATSISGNEIVVTQIKSIPRGEPVLLNNETTTTTDNVFGQGVQGNLLKHATEDVQLDEECDYYGLYNGAFERVKTIPAGKNYLMVSNAVVPGGNAPQLTIVFDNEATGVNDVRSKMEDVRGDIYDLQGRKVQKPSKKGLYINKGHKVVVK